jgi:hypothetical protein
MDLRRLIAPAVCIALFAAACGSGSGSGSGSADNGESAKSANRILADARAAVGKAQDVHVFGASPQTSTNPVQLDLRVRHGAGTGTISMGGNVIHLIRIGSSVYMKAGGRFWQTFGKNPAVVQLLQNRWIKFTASNPNFGPLARLLDEQQFMQQTLQPKGRVVKAGTRTYRGQRVVVLRDTGDTNAGELYIATTGAPYPVAIVDTAQHAVIHFDSWNQTFQLSAPAGALDFSKFSS